MIDAIVPARRAMSASLLTGLLLLAGCGGGGGGGSAGVEAGGSSSVSSTPTNQPPTVAAKLNSEVVLNAVTVFDTTGTADSDGGVAMRSWNYGDGQTGADDNHVYTSAGNFTATYTVTDNNGASASTSVPVTVAKCSKAGSAAAALSPHTTVCVQTSRGEMVFEVFPVQAPVAAANFMKYVDDGFYSGTLFHRVIPDFVIQGGGYLPGMVAKAATNSPIALESNNGLKNWQYTLAMARTPVPDSATSQFFVNLVDNPALDYDAANPSPNGYAVFGQVIYGTAVVNAIADVATGTSSGFANVPVEDVVIRGMARLP